MVCCFVVQLEFRRDDYSNWLLLIDRWSEHLVSLQRGDGISEAGRAQLLFRFYFFVLLHELAAFAHLRVPLSSHGSSTLANRHHW